MCEQTSVPSISVREWMDNHEPMVKPDCNLERRIDVILEPELRVAQDDAWLFSNLGDWNSKIFFCISMLTRPFPAKHLPFVSDYFPNSIFPPMLP